ncbi:MAG: MFS transporter [Anaerolineae bacterium]
MRWGVLGRIRAGLDAQGITLRATYLLFYAAGAAWFPFFYVYLHQTGLSGLQIGAIAGVRPAVVLLSQPLWGLAADNLGRRRVLLFTMACAALLPLGYAWQTAFWFVFGWTILYALLSNPVSSLIDSLVLDYLELRRDHSYGRLRLWGAVGWAASSLAVGRLVAGRDLRLTLVFAAAFMLLGWALLWRRTADHRNPVQGKPSWRGLSDLLRTPRLLLFLGLVVLMQLGAASITTFYSVYMDGLGATPTQIGLAYSIQGLSELPIYLIAAAIIRRLSPGGALGLAFFFFAARALLYAAIADPIAAMAVEVFHGMSWSLFLVSGVDYVNRQVPVALRATGQSLFATAYFGAGAISGNAWAGYLMDRLGAQGMYRVNGVLLLAVAVATLLLLREPAVQPGAAAGAATEGPSA